MRNVFNEVNSVGGSVWGSVRDSVGASVWSSVRDSVGGSVWGSVRGFVVPLVYRNVLEHIKVYLGGLFR